MLWAFALSAKAAEPDAPSASAAPPVRHLKKLLLTVGIEEAQKLPPDASDQFVVIAPPLSFFNEAELTKRLAGGQGRRIDDTLLAAIAQVIEKYAQQRDYPIATAVIPPQNIADGTVRVAVLLGKVRDIKVEGNRWFSDSLLREKLRIDHGGILRISELDRAISWTNTNPFRQVKVHIEPVPGTGEADIIVGVNERFPLRLQAMMDNSGPDLLGRERYIAAVTHGNLWGADHRATYQYITSNKWDVFQGHSLDYQVPLPWRHAFQLTGSYMLATPTLEEGYIEQDAKSITVEAKYIAPFTLKRWLGELSANIGFKQTNNNVIFLGEPVPYSLTDVFTTALGAAVMRPDARGRWVISATLTASPGDLNSRNNDEAYFYSRIGSRARFMHGQVAIQRLTQLTPKLTALSRAMAQLASTNLLATEQFSIGGHSTVRGYTDQLLSGDGGYIFSQELQHTGPTFELGNRLPALMTSGIAFWDYGRVLVKHPLGRYLKSADIAGVGLGLRFGMGSNFSAAVDYGHPIVETPDEHGKLHVRVSVAY